MAQSLTASFSGAVGCLLCSLTMLSNTYSLRCSFLREHELITDDAAKSQTPRRSQTACAQSEHNLQPFRQLDISSRVGLSTLGQAPCHYLLQDQAPCTCPFCFVHYSRAVSPPFDDVVGPYQGAPKLQGYLCAVSVLAAASADGALPVRGSAANPVQHYLHPCRGGVHLIVACQTGTCLHHS